MARRKVNVAATLAAAFKLLIKILNGIVVVSCCSPSYSASRAALLHLTGRPRGEQCCVMMGHAL